MLSYDESMNADARSAIPPRAGEAFHPRPTRDDNRRKGFSKNFSGTPYVTGHVTGAVL